MSKEITYEALKEVFEKANYEVMEPYYISGGFTTKYLDSLEFKFEVCGGMNYQSFSIFLGKEKGLWFLEDDETRKFFGANIENMDEMLFILKTFKIIDNE